MSSLTRELSPAPSELQKLVDDAMQGGEIVLTRDGTPLAKIVPLRPGLVAHDIVGLNGKIISPIRFLRGRPVYSSEDVANMEPRYSKNIDK